MNAKTVGLIHLCSFRTWLFPVFLNFLCYSTAVVLKVNSECYYSIKQCPCTRKGLVGIGFFFKEAYTVFSCFYLKELTKILNILPINVI
jgi:hypothetical protein